MNSIQLLKVIAVVGAATLGTAQLANAQNTTDPSSSDKKFVRAALAGENAEVDMGKLAVQKGSSDDVKDFGRKMVDDHMKLGEEMRTVADKEGIRAPAGMNAKERAMVSKLQSLSGENFDKAYIAAMVKDHRGNLAAFKREASAGNDTAIKEEASQSTKVIEQHLQLAQEMARNHKVPVEQSGQ
jgi:putative membrane protein